MAGENNNWIEAISYYRYEKGRNVFVYALMNKSKNLIVDVLVDDRVLLLDKYNEPFTEDYEKILTSRKYFSYQSHPTDIEVILPEPYNDNLIIPVERVVEKS